MTQNEYVLSAIPNPLVLIIILLAIGCFIFAMWVISLNNDDCGSSIDENGITDCCQVDYITGESPEEFKDD